MNERVVIRPFGRIIYSPPHVSAKEAGYALFRPAEQDPPVSGRQALQRRLSAGAAAGHYSLRCEAVPLLHEFLAGDEELTPAPSSRAPGCFM